MSQTDYYYKVNSFLVGHDALIYKNVILPKVLSPCINRLELMESMAPGDEGAQELEYNIIHGAREEREACARGKDEGKDAGERESQTGTQAAVLRLPIWLFRFGWSVS